MLFASKIRRTKYLRLCKENKTGYNQFQRLSNVFWYCFTKTLLGSGLANENDNIIFQKENQNENEIQNQIENQNEKSKKEKNSPNKRFLIKTKFKSLNQFKNSLSQKRRVGILFNNLEIFSKINSMNSDIKKETLFSR